MGAFDPDEPFTYLYGRTAMPEPIPGMGTVGGVGDVLSIPLQGLFGQSIDPGYPAYGGNRAANDVYPAEAMQRLAQILRKTPSPPAEQTVGGSDVAGPGVDEDFVYRPTSHDPVDVVPLPPAAPTARTIVGAPAKVPPERSPLSPEVQARNLAIARDAMSKPEVLAFMRAIATGETTTGDYDKLNGGRRFKGWDYPEGEGRAAGAYQITPGTYKDMRRDLGLNDFSPDTQDLMAAWLIARNKAHEPLLRGDVESTIKSLRGTWPSLPGGDQPNIHTPTFADRYHANLGRLRRE